MPVDVAISAPFGQGLSGTVYIYRGSRQGIITTPAQTLVGSELNLMPSAVEGLTSFGAFLSGTTDIDGNQYNGEHPLLASGHHSVSKTCVVFIPLAIALCRSHYWSIYVAKGVCHEVRT